MREKDIQHLIRLLEEHEEIAEIEVTRFPLFGGRLRVSRRSAQAPPMQMAHPVAAARVPADEGEPAASAQEDVGEGLHAIKAPMVGTFYSAPSPDADAFVSEGARVTPGKVLCIIEAMKLMNEIECDINGTVREIRIENGEPVEFGQILFLIEAD
jgi:acetyl-CoA carboxylase biotin carboxyl carrier protein